MKQDLIIKLIETLVNTEDKQSTPIEDNSRRLRIERPVVVFANNCIIYGYSSDYKLGDVTLNKAQYCHYYAKPDSDKKKGFMALAKYGPAKGSKVSSPVDYVTVDALCIIDATEEAQNVWENSEWK